MTNTNAAVLERWRTLCAAYGITFVDYHAAISAAVAGGANKTDYMADTVHPANGGHTLAHQILRSPLLGLMAGGTMPAMPARIYDCADMESAPTVRDGTDNDGETGAWTTNTTWRVSSAANSTISFTGTFAAFGLFHANAGVIQWSLDGGAFSSDMNLASYGPYRELSTDVIARAEHTLTIKVISGTVTIKQFLAV